MESALEAVAQRVSEIRSAISLAASRAGREPTGVRLMAVVKTRGPEQIAEVVAAGVDLLGENRVQEGEAHLQALPAAVRAACRVHFIGQLQANKARRAVKVFDALDSVDSDALALRLSRIAEEEGVSREVLIEVNLGAEDQKGGVLSSHLERLCGLVISLPGLDLVGLQGVSPLLEEPEASRPFFRHLKQLYDRERQRHPRPERFCNLSMGMSHDFEVAIEEGATLVRIGTALFGPRRPL